MTREEAIETLGRIESVAVATLAPTDVLVLSVQHTISSHVRERIHSLMAEVFPANKCIVLEDGAELRVVSGRAEQVPA